MKKTTNKIILPEIPENYGCYFLRYVGLAVKKYPKYFKQKKCERKSSRRRE